MKFFVTADISNKTVEYSKSFAAVVYVPSNAASAKYAIPMHENKYILGKHSAAKQKKVSVPQCIILFIVMQAKGWNMSVIADSSELQREYSKACVAPGV